MFEWKMWTSFFIWHFMSDMLVSCDYAEVYLTWVLPEMLEINSINIINLKHSKKTSETFAGKKLRKYYEISWWESCFIVFQLIWHPGPMFRRVPQVSHGNRQQPPHFFLFQLTATVVCVTFSTIARSVSVCLPLSVWDPEDTSLNPSHPPPKKMMFLPNPATVIYGRVYPN